MVDSVDIRRKYHFLAPHSASASKSAFKQQSLYSIKDGSQTIIEPIYTPPFRRYDGQWVFADGTFFNPGFGRGMYYWDSQQPVGVFRGDGIQYATIPRWKPQLGYVIDFGTVIPGTGSLGAVQYLISGGTAALNEHSYVRVNANNLVEFNHSQSHPTQVGNVISANPLVEGVPSTLVVFVTESAGVGDIAVVLDNVETRNAFTYNNDLNTGFYTTMFASSDALGTEPMQEMIVTGVALGDLVGTEDRFYPLDDDPVATPNVMRDTGDLSQDGTWVNQVAGNHITTEGAWIPVNNFRVETT